MSEIWHFNHGGGFGLGNHLTSKNVFAEHKTA